MECTILNETDPKKHIEKINFTQVYITVYGNVALDDDCSNSSPGRRYIPCAASGRELGDDGRNAFFTPVEYQFVRFFWSAQL